MTTKQWLAMAIIVVILLCTLLGIAGVWGFIDGESVGQLFATLVVCAVGLGTVAHVIDTYFKDQ
jgi:hypothetical protein